MDEVIKININSKSRIPKYQQIVNSIINDIEKENIKIGQKIPSINEISEEYYLSRDTVEKAYNMLKQQQIIVATKGKGYYVARTDLISKDNILLLLNKPSTYKMIIYNAFRKSLHENAHVDLHIYHCEPNLFLNILKENLDLYDHYVIMPHFKDENSRHINMRKDILKAINRIPQDKLLIIDNDLQEVQADYGTIYQDFKNDIYTALNEGIDLIKKYRKVIMAYPNQSIYPYPQEILIGFRKFCVGNAIDFEIIDEIPEDIALEHKALYIVIEEMDLVHLIKQARDMKLKVGKDLGIISYNETPLKDVLGITVISTDFKLMGETAAYMLLKNKKEKVKNAFRLIRRNST